MGKFLFWVLIKLGWKIDNHPPQGVKQAVIVLGPHTSNWDFVIGNIAFQKYKINARFLIKKELFFPPLGWLLRGLGGIPINRSKNTNFTDEAVKLFKENEELYLVFTPEGTRKYSPNWRKGFYFIAQKANVPIYIGYIDYKKKNWRFSLFVCSNWRCRRGYSENKRDFKSVLR
jgi:1-acyl-sn-glycerol-3-phosphate acyltransferase